MRRLLRSFYHAGRGVIFVLRWERNLQIHIGVAFLVLLLGIFCHLSLLEFSILFLVIFLVIATELINSIIELIIDYISPHFNPKARLIKDIAAGVVLLVAFGAVVIGVLIFYPHLLLFNH